MPCYHPIAARQQLNENENGKRPVQILGLYDPEAFVRMPDVFPLPCGKCLGCRLDYSRQWADRMMLELDHTKQGIFVTLTYNDEKLPDYSSLRKKDFQDFMKRLRKYCVDHLSNKKIRYYACGEYGSTTFRPHYHAIIFGLSLSDFSDCQIKGKNEFGQAYYISDIFADIWDNGFALLSEVSWKTMAYVARYTMKKVGVDPMQTEYFHEVSGTDPEFVLMSRRPGIGSYFFEDHKEIFKNKLTKYFVGDQDGSKEVNLTKFHLNQLKGFDFEWYEELKDMRKHIASDKLLLELQNTDLDFKSYMKVKEEAKLNQIVGLKRA